MPVRTRCHPIDDATRRQSVNASTLITAGLGKTTIFHLIEITALRYFDTHHHNFVFSLVFSNETDKS